MQYPVMEHFYTIQGEGAHTGKAAYFIRLGGCDVGCHWCDVKESWTSSETQLMSIDAILKEANKVKASFVVITGGEPTMHSLLSLVNLLHDQGIEVAIEGRLINKSYTDKNLVKRFSTDIHLSEILILTKKKELV